MTGVATAVAVGVDSKVTIPNLSLIFVVPVIIAGVSLGLGPSLCSAILGAIAFNFFLTEPRYTLVVDDPANIWAKRQRLAWEARKQAADFIKARLVRVPPSASRAVRCGCERTKFIRSSAPALGIIDGRGFQAQPRWLAEAYFSSLLLSCFTARVGVLLRRFGGY